MQKTTNKHYWKIIEKSWKTAQVSIYVDLNETKFSIL